MDERERYRKGLEVRRAVLGDEHVDRALARQDDLDAEFQELITRHAWGEIWTRPGLPRGTRSLLALAMTVALNRGEEFRLHLRGAARNGVRREEVKELLLQAAVYCGLPAANAAFRMAREVFEEMDRDEAKGSPAG
jgi:4-carboxymuconolactone decarboxylase